MDHERRISELERDVATLLPLQGKVMVLESQIENMGREIGELKQTIKDGFEKVDKRFDKSEEDQKATRRVTMAFAFTVAGSCVATLLTLTATGVIG